MVVPPVIVFMGVERELAQKEPNSLSERSIDWFWGGLKRPRLGYRSNQCLFIIRKSQPLSFPAPMLTLHSLGDTCDLSELYLKYL